MEKVSNRIQNTSRPWVEKYRPDNYDNIVMDDLTRTILTNVLDTNHFPNMLLYGPPGTGKTTTIVNLVNEYRKRNKESGKGHVIHLNASDERGIDVIRNQISQFVHSMNMFTKGTKFVILDEVDYMTGSAQHALKHLLQGYNNVKFCLICNYISKIDESLRNEFLRIRFNQLPPHLILSFLKNIRDKEQLKLSNDDLVSIQTMFGSDMRSMINFMQSNSAITNSLNPINDETWNRLAMKIRTKDLKNIQRELEIYRCNGIRFKNIIRDLTNYIIRNIEHADLMNERILDGIEFIIHSESSSDDILKTYFLENILPFIG